MEEKVTQIRLPDGRYGETRTTETIDCPNGEGQRIYERYEEEPRALHLAERIVEKQKPVVVERTIETIRNGEVVETKVESIDPGVKMQLREHIALARTQAQAVDEQDCYVTKKDLSDVFIAAIEEFRNAQQPRVRLQEAVEQNVEESKVWVWAQYGLIGCIGVELAILVYQWVPRLMEVMGS